MTTVNVPRTKTESNYRYFRHKLQVTVQGSGGNIKTKLDNIIEVAKDLKVPPECKPPKIDPLKFIGYELGAQTDIKNNEYLISGNHKLEKLEDTIEKYSH